MAKINRMSPIGCIIQAGGREVGMTLFLPKTGSEFFPMFPEGTVVDCMLCYISPERLVLGFLTIDRQ